MQEPEKWLLSYSWPDSWPGIALLFALFLYFFLGALGFGTLLHRGLFGRGSRLTEWGNSFLFASLLLYGVAFALAALQGLHWAPRAVLWIAFFPGFCVQALELPRALRTAWQRWPVFLVLAALVLLVRALSAAQPSQHGDPLLYHLLGPRLWVEAGGFLMHPQLPNALLAASWECLYVWPQLLWFSSKPLYGLVEAQLFSQWLHLFLAWGGGALLVMRVLRGFASERWLPLLGFSALFISGVQWTAPLAKNDVGIAFWCLGALAFLLEGAEERSKIKALLSGLFAGLALSGKVTALLSLAPLLGMAFLFARPWRAPGAFAGLVLLWLAGLLAGAVPTYARNFLLAGNPFFPLFPGLFPSPWLSPTWQAHFAQVHPSSPFQAIPLLWKRLPELIRESPFALAGLLLFLPLGRGRLRALLLGAAAAYAIFVLTQSKDIELRYLGASLMLLGAGGVALLLQAGERLPHPRASLVAAALVTVALFASSRLPLHLLWKIWPSPLGLEYVRTHTAGEAKAWLRARAEGSFTVVAGDNETYYLTPLAVTVLTERPDLDAATIEEKNFASFVRKVCELTRARYLLDARPAIGVEAKFGAAALLPAKVFSAQGANVYDLSALENALLPPGPRSCR